MFVHRGTLALVTGFHHNFGISLPNGLLIANFPL